MSFKSEFKKLVTRLGEDPKIKEAIGKLGRASSRPNFAALPESLVATLLLAGRFVGKSRMRTFVNFIDAAVFLISLSLMIKQNVFDKPEVQDFIKKTWKDISKTTTQLTRIVRGYVERRLSLLRAKKSVV